MTRLTLLERLELYNDVVESLNRRDHGIAYVHRMLEDERCTPWELYVGPVNCWIRCDATWLSGWTDDKRYFAFRPGFLARLWLRAAILVWSDER